MVHYIPYNYYTLLSHFYAPENSLMITKSTTGRLLHFNSIFKDVSKEKHQTSELFTGKPGQAFPLLAN